VLAYAGIGNPQRFFDLLARLGAEVAATRTFADHHAFSETDAEALLHAAAASNARLVTTEKDLVRLVGRPGRRAALLDASSSLPITLAFAPGDLERLRTLLAGVLKVDPPRGA
jgi:tetraacyldisaccharide 4'-kinase